MKTIELFGKVYEEIEDDSSECACALCALFERCKKTVESDLPCEQTDGSVNRHFVLVMDYEKKYKEALERARKIHTQTEFDYEKGMMEEVFQELKESEDEKEVSLSVEDDEIRKEIMDYLKDFIPHYDVDLATKAKKWISWLEKQGKQDNHVEEIDNSFPPKEIAKSIGKSLTLSLINYLDNNRCEGAMNMSSVECEDLENSILDSDWGKIYRYMRKKLGNPDRQKETLEKQDGWMPVDVEEPNFLDDFRRSDTEEDSINKTEPKFKVGDWITGKDFITAKIINIDDDKYEVEFIDGSKGFHPIDFIDRHFHHWNMEDVKEGDVLACNDEVTGCPFIFHKLTKERNPRSYCGVDTSGHFQVNDEKGEFWCCSYKVKPANKEQRDFLFQRMSEAGYKWDADKKELVEIL